jgi:hypothetical protein
MVTIDLGKQYRESDVARRVYQQNLISNAIHLALSNVHRASGGKQG